VRRHAGPEPTTLAGYRVRHARYKTDPDLQAAHGRHPSVVTWHDHEVENDYAGLHPADGGDPAAVAAAYVRPPPGDAGRPTRPLRMRAGHRGPDAWPAPVASSG
jgi:alkaline phosphatase D